METSGSFTVYRHISPNGKSYIGITERDPELRWQNGNGYQGQKKFWNAIVKYGWDNFEHLILYTGLSCEEACEKEIELIRLFDSVNNGYNTSTGGKYGSAGAYKYKDGDVINGFEIVGRDGVKLVVKCLDCGAILRRHVTCFALGCIKCKCKLKRQPPQHKMNYREVIYNGERRRLRDVARELGIPSETVWGRYSKGQAIDVPLREARKDLQCPVCGNMFRPRWSGQKYCSPECQHKSMRIERDPRICKYCGKEFIPTRTEWGNYKAIFCCKDCSIAYQKEQARKSLA